MGASRAMLPRFGIDKHQVDRMDEGSVGVGPA